MPAFGAWTRVLLALAGACVCVATWAQPAPTAAASGAATAAASAPAAADAGASAPAKPKAPLPPREQYSEKGADTCLVVPRPGERLAGLLGRRGHLQGRARAARRPARSVRPGRPAVRGVPRPRRAPRHAWQRQEAAIDQQLQGRARSLTAQERDETCLGVPPGPGAQRRLARRRARARSGLACAELPPDASGPRRGARRRSSEAEVCFSCHRQERGGLPEAVDAPGALRPDELQRLPQPARLEHDGDVEQAHAQPDRASAATPTSADPCSGSMRPSQRTARSAIRRTVRCAAPCSPSRRRCCASNAMRRRTIPRSRGRASRCPAAAPAGRSFSLRGAAPTATRGSMAVITRQEPS